MSDIISKLREKVNKTFPNKSGVYIMRDAFGSVIYIGKAKNLKKRASNYFKRKFEAYNAKLSQLREIVADIDYQITRNEGEAKILENKLIKEWKPRINTLEKDDKNYLLLRVEMYLDLPKFTFERNRKEDNSLYFGPYLNTKAIQTALKELKKAFGIITYEASPKKLPDNTWMLYNDARSEISKFPNIVTKEEYLERVQKALDYLKGRDKQSIKDAEEKMNTASANLEFEKAKKYRDIIDAIKETSKANARAKITYNLSKTSKEVAETAMQALCEILKIQSANTIECFDISHISGSFCVASMVHFENGEPEKNKYRRFKIKSFIGQDDFRSLGEVLTRRFNEYKKGEDESFKQLPDLILLDGGLAQVTAVRKILSDFSLEIPLFGMVKDSKHKTRAITSGGGDIEIKANRKAYTLVTAIQDEVHRFAIDYHHKRNKMTTLASELLSIDGVGPATAKKLILKFKTIGSIRSATVAELKSKGFSEKVAQNVFNFYKK